MGRWGALPARGAIFSNRDSIFLSLLFDATCLMSVSCLFWHLLSVRTYAGAYAHAPLPLRAPSWPHGAPSIGRQVVGWQMKRWGGRFFRWGGTCHPISIQSYAPAQCLVQKGTELVTALPSVRICQQIADHFHQIEQLMAISTQRQCLQQPLPTT